MTEIEKRFWRYHTNNPHVYAMFKGFSFQAALVKQHYSADAVLHRMRWFTDIETHGEVFKINNNYAAYYARLFMGDFPQHAGFFRIRVLADGRPIARSPLRTLDSGHPIVRSPLGALDRLPKGVNPTM